MMRIRIELQDDGDARFGTLTAEVNPQDVSVVTFFLARGPTDEPRRFAVAGCELRALLAACDALARRA